MILIPVGAAARNIIHYCRTDRITNLCCISGIWISRAKSQAAERRKKKEQKIKNEAIYHIMTKPNKNAGIGRMMYVRD